MKRKTYQGLETRKVSSPGPCHLYDLFLGDVHVGAGVVVWGRPMAHRDGGGRVWTRVSGGGRVLVVIVVVAARTSRRVEISPSSF
jgi:hypothetical protein